MKKLTGSISTSLYAASTFKFEIVDEGGDDFRIIVVPVGRAALNGHTQLTIDGVPMDDTLAKAEAVTENGDLLVAAQGDANNQLIKAITEKIQRTFQVRGFNKEQSVDLGDITKKPNEEDIN